MTFFLALGFTNFRNSYGTPHRVYCTVTYPLQSSNKSTIIIYGHANGARIVWRGGRRFKSSSHSTAKNDSNVNGATDNAVMIVDSDDEQPPSNAAAVDDNPEFVEEDDEVDPLKPYPSILQHLDLNFGTSILHLAVPSAEIVDNPSGLSPAILNDSIVFAAACTDHSVRLISLPLTPPSPASKSRGSIHSHITAGNAGSGKWGETMVQLIGHSAIPDGLSITLSASSSAESSLIEGGGAKAGSKSRNSDVAWDVLVASHSREASGLLLLYRVPVDSTTVGGKIVQSFSKSTQTPSQTQHLSSPAISVAFNPSLLSAYSTHLLVSDKTGACRIYDCQASLPANKTEESTPNLFSTQGGSWLLTLYPGFQSSKSEATNLSAFSASNYGRKALVDAKWVVGGNAVLVLLADGEWGLWDIGGAGPRASNGLLGQHSIKGSAKTAFSISGWVDGAPIKSASARTAGFQAPGKFAPMTPGTRKIVEPALFNGRTGSGPVHGQISVARLSTTSTIHLADECVVFWLGEAFAVIPNLSAYWEAQMRKKAGGQGNLFGSKSASHLVRLRGVDLRGERCSGISQSVRSTSTSKVNLPTEILITAEHRFLIVSDAALETPQQLPRQSKLAITHNETRLASTGELDILGIDQALAEMEDSPTFGKRKVDLFG